MKRNSVFIIEQRSAVDGAWYPWGYAGDTRLEAESNLMEVKEANPVGRDNFRLAPYYSAESEG